jgi:MFS family permease
VTAALLALNARTFRSIRKHHNYRLFFVGQLVSLSGTWMQNVALAWLIVELTNSPLALGILAFCRFIPFTLFGLGAGVVADRLDNRRLLIATQLSSMVVSVALALLAFSGDAQAWMAYLLALLGGTAMVFDAPARHALTFQMVGRDELPNAVALNASLFNAARVTGPAIGGGVIAAVGVGWCFAINAVSFLAVLTALLLMRVSELHAPERNGKKPTLWAGTREGLRYAWNEPRVRMVILITGIVATIGFNFHVLVPVLASHTLHAGPEVFGLLSACFGAGALVGALMSAAIARGSFRNLFAGTVGMSVLMLALAPVRNEWLAGALLFLIGICFIQWTSNSQSILQLTVPDALRGRVLGIYLFAFAGLAPAGSLLAGWLSEIGGTELAFAVAGATGLATAFWAAFELKGDAFREWRLRRRVALIEETPLP